MSEDAPPSRPGEPWIAWALAGLLLAYTAWLYFAAGPPLPAAQGQWYAPTGSLRESAWAQGILASRALTFLAFAGPAGLGAIAVWVTTRQAGASTLAASCALAAPLFVLYGLVQSTPWQIFGGHGSAVLVLVALCVGSAIASPRWARAWLARGWPLRVALYAPVALVVVAFLRNATGTDPGLLFGLSPWPAVPVFGLEVGALFVAIVAFAASIGAAGIAALRAGNRRRGLVSLGLSALAPAVAVGLGDALGLLPFRAGLGPAIALGAASLLVAGAAGALPSGPGPNRVRRLRIGAALVALPILLGQIWAYVDYTLTREVRARRVTDALQAYLERETLYPDDLETLVATGDLEEIPVPAIGFDTGEREPFGYQNFGTSFLLEFSATRWVQCAYAPPVVYEDEEERLEMEALGYGAEEAWSCPSRPPEVF